jgi:hypothetical protein
VRRPCWRSRRLNPPLALPGGSRESPPEVAGVRLAIKRQPDETRATNKGSSQFFH